MSESKKAIIIVVSVIPAAILAGFTIQTLWGWFVCPLGVSSLTLTQAIGIDIFISFLTSKIWQGKIQKDKLFRRWLQASFCHPPAYLLLGYIVTLFM